MCVGREDQVFVGKPVPVNFVYHKCGEMWKSKSVLRGKRSVINSLGHDTALKLGIFSFYTFLHPPTCKIILKKEVEGHLQLNKFYIKRAVS
jgi:hypothetical protein